MNEAEELIGEPRLDLFDKDRYWVVQYYVHTEPGAIVFKGEGENVPDALRDLADEMEAE